MKLLSTLPEADRKLWLSWAWQQPLTQAIYARSTNGRLEAWYGRASNLRPIGKGGLVTIAPDPPDFVHQWVDAWLPGWNSLLVCGGNTTIDWHRDHQHFEDEVVMVNLGRALFELGAPRQPAKSHQLEDGQVVGFNLRMPHRSTQQSEERFAFTFRRIRGEYL